MMQMVQTHILGQKWPKLSAQQGFRGSWAKSLHREELRRDVSESNGEANDVDHRLVLPFGYSQIVASGWIDAPLEYVLLGDHRRRNLLNCNWKNGFMARGLVHLVAQWSKSDDQWQPFIEVIC
jgi:hypothetical protein